MSDVSSKKFKRAKTNKVQAPTITIGHKAQRPTTARTQGEINGGFYRQRRGYKLTSSTANARAGGAAGDRKMGQANKGHQGQSCALVYEDKLKRKQALTTKELPSQTERTKSRHHQRFRSLLEKWVDFLREEFQ